MSCKQVTQTLFEPLSPTTTHINFSNTLVETDTLNLLEFAYFYNGGGVGIGDVNNDGLSDIYFTGNQVSSQLYLNKGNLQFEDITKSAGVGTDRWARGVAMVDINMDGLLDIYVSVSGTTRISKMENLLFINQGNDASGKPAFKESAIEYGLADTAHTTQTAFMDYDRDGDLDAYLLTNAIESFSPNTSRPKKIKGEGLSTDRLYRNEGVGANGHPIFKDVSKEAGITIEGYGLGIAVSDLNRDGWPDIYCANDFVSNDLVWINNGDGTFTDQAATYLQHQSYNGMGIDIADFNNDGLQDIVVLDMLPEDNKRQKTMGGAIKYEKYILDTTNGYQPQFVRNTLQLNRGARPVAGKDSSNKSIPIFSEIGQLAGVSNTDWSWSALFADFDNDGYRDLFITNGYAKDITDLDYVMYHQQETYFGDRESIRAKQRELSKKLPAVKVHNYIYQNRGDLTFADQSNAWGLSQPTLSNGAAYADMDNDGDLDLVVNNINEPAGIYKNNAADWAKNTSSGIESNYHFLRIKVNGPASNRQALGASIRLRYGAHTQVHEHSVYRGFQSTVENTIHFGLGTANQVDSLEITWPDGKYQLLRQVKANQLLTIDYKDARELSPVPTIPLQPLFTETSQILGIDYVHKENHYIDFKSQPLLHQKYSRNGPGIAVGDVNGDGLEDFFVGGASGSSGKVFLQHQPSSWQPARFTSFTIDLEGKKEEDMGSLLFDADSDGDLDLYVVSGGSEFTSATGLYQDRLYINDGKGNFTKDTTALPQESESGSSVTAADFDRDGDLDLFVAGRVSPHAYPYAPQSYLLRNDKGKFINVTREVNPDLQTIGMVSSALWTDFDNDGWVDLLLAGEWMPLTFFKNQKGKFVNVTDDTGLTHTSGWWNSLAGGDFDNDGDIDYIAGNLGNNSKFKASPKEPVCVYASDFDNSGTLDPVLCYYLPGADGKRVSYPAHPRDELITQMTSMRRRFVTFADYAAASTKDLFTEEELEKAYVGRSEYFQSSYVENLGKGKFSIKPLPVEAQFAPVFGMLCNDYDGDGNLDLLLSGNSYAPDIKTGQYDALLGLYLKGDGKGNFKPVPAAESGFYVEGDAKGMAELLLGDGNLLLLSAVNSGKLKSHVLSKPKLSHTIKLGSLDAYAEITFSNGKKRRQESYYGSTYLSQSSRVLFIPMQPASINITEYAGKRRMVKE
ncbi:VCBS repeat-containing protein [Rhodocytophaga rosea]|nr:FG-GAP-like repeat-containing protein [Rhodocytophaga rosea]